MEQSRLISFALVAPALLILLALFVYPLGFSLVTAFVDESGAWTFGNFSKAFEFYSRDILFTVVIVGAVDRPDRGLLDRDRRLSGARRASGRGRACCAGCIAGRCSFRSSSPAR